MHSVSAHNFGRALDDVIGLAREFVARRDVETYDGNLHICREKSAKTLEIAFVGSVGSQIPNVNLLVGSIMFFHLSPIAVVGKNHVLHLSLERKPSLQRYCGNIALRRLITSGV